MGTQTVIEIKLQEEFIWVIHVSYVLANQDYHRFCSSACPDLNVILYTVQKVEA